MKHRLTLLTVFVALAAASIGHPTQTLPRLWQEVVEEADFVGIVTCEVAGGIVAHYRVEEVWTGDVEVGSSVALKMNVDPFGLQYPVALVGMRLFVTSSREPGGTRPREMSADSTGAAVWWRHVPWDYRLSDFGGAVRLNVDIPFWSGLGTTQTKLEHVRRDFVAFMALGREQRALLIIREVAAKNAAQDYLGDKERFQRAYGRIAAARSLDEAATSLVDEWDSDAGTSYRELRSDLARFVYQAPEVARRRFVEKARSPRDQTYVVKEGDTLEKISTEVFGTPHHASQIRHANREKIPASNDLPPGTLLTVRVRQELITWCNLLDVLRAENRERDSRPSMISSEADIQKATETFTIHREEKPEFWKAADVLVVYDPARVAAWLREWENPHPEYGVERSINLGSWFGARCASDRAALLASLLDAKDPYVRVASAIHLTFEDEARGARALQRLRTLPDEAGAWAALALARRGDRSAMHQVVEVLTGANLEGTITNMPRFNLQMRALELLSNSAAARGLPTPVWQLDATAYEKATAFLAAHPDIVPIDPWLPVLRAQKID